MDEPYDNAAGLMLEFVWGGGSVICVYQKKVRYAMLRNGNHVKQTGGYAKC